VRVVIIAGSWKVIEEKIMIPAIMSRIDATSFEMRKAAPFAIR